MFKDSQNSYGALTKVFHWLSAVIILALLVMGVWMIDLDYENYWYDIAMSYHENIGILFFILIALRLLWSWFDMKPSLSSTLSILERKSAGVVHKLLYLLCITMVVSGYLMATADGRGISVFAWFVIPSIGSFHHQQADLAGGVHYWSSCGLMALIALHMLAAYKHHFIDKDSTLRKIL